MRILLCIVSLLFGGLSMFAAISQVRDKKRVSPAIVMILGSFVLMVAVVCNLVSAGFDYIAALLGCTAICIAAVWNGIDGGNFHFQHHVIRILLSLGLTIGFVLF